MSIIIGKCIRIDNVTSFAKNKTKSFLWYCHDNLEEEDRTPCVIYNSDKLKAKMRIKKWRTMSEAYGRLRLK